MAGRSMAEHQPQSFGPVIDAHIHFAGDHPRSLELLDELDLKLLNVTVADLAGTWREREAEPYRELSQRWPHRYAWCTSFDPPATSEEDPEYTVRVIEGLEDDFRAGAIACKIWKNVGMEATDASGRYIMIDDPVLEPILSYLEDGSHTLLTHIGEPLACWLPLDHPSPHREYYRRNPQWHMYGRTDVPAHEQLMAARDRVLARHPSLRVVGAHLGSLEYDLDELASRLDAYDNFAVDTSARFMDLVSHGGKRLRDFFLTYHDRILFGTDVVARRPHSEMADVEREELYEKVRKDYLAQHAYFAGNQPVTFGDEVHDGIELPDDVLREFFRENARSWYPGL